MFDRLMREIRSFTQNLNESLVDAWLRMKDLLRTCHGHGIFLYKTPNEAYRFLEDHVLLKRDWSKDIKAKPIRKTVAFVEGTNNFKLMEKLEALAIKIDSQFKDIKGEIKEMRDGCNSCGGPHPSSKYDDKPMGGPEEEANYVYEGYRGGGYQGNYYGTNSRNWRDRQPRDDNRTSQNHEDNQPTPPTPEKKLDETKFKK
ncbi:hypothetical protein Tco_0804577 [Tanacetum coccineum]|uniref:Reverse transcriptase domain-containing protein n=1 Tax=Tanacetum coccineum TaxID=301880 RepID=A0ABQ5A4P6_9ASTR